ncbi:MAG TPA: transposase [Verrucomicrobiae bacterium]|nr:transposase [Verrucomicrobiae bacterium]
MPRIARPVFPGLPHHVTQRGNRQADIFLCNADRTQYLEWLKEYCAAAEVEMIAYCLMRNHVHFVAILLAADSFERVFHRLHTRYAQRFNRITGFKGHVMQGRYFSAALDESHLWTAIRYVERNPVRAGMVQKAQDYAWSSAAMHCGLRTDPVVNGRNALPRDFVSTADWPKWLSSEEDSTQVNLLRTQSLRGLPCGSDDFVSSLEMRAGVPLKRRPRGRPWPQENKGARP